eukprot:831648-Pleurochrysis_carterae.AAC.1
MLGGPSTTWMSDMLNVLYICAADSTGGCSTSSALKRRPRGETPYTLPSWMKSTLSSEMGGG